MEALRPKQVRSLLGFLRGLYAADSEASFARYVISELPKVLPSDIAGYNAVDPLKVKISYVCDPADAPFPEPWIFEQHMKDHPVLNYHQKTKDGSARKISDFLTRNQFHRLGLYNQFYRKIGVEYQIALCLFPRRPEMIGIALNRGRKDFSERDRYLLNLIRPHLLQAYYNVEAKREIERQLADASRVMEVASIETIVLEGSRVRFMTPRGEKLLRNYFPGGNTDEIPSSLQRWIDKQLALLKQDADPPTPNRPLIIEHNQRRLLIRLLARPNQTQLVLQEQHTAPRLEDLTRLGLTQRETEVLYWVSQGKTNSEVASILTASARTIAKHLERIYQKLGVESRTAAALLALTFLT